MHDSPFNDMSDFPFKQFALIITLSFGLIAGLALFTNWAITPSTTLEEFDLKCANICAPSDYKTLNTRCFCATVPALWKEVESPTIQNP